MHHPQDDRGEDKGIGHAGDRVCELDAELAVVVVDPATIDRGNAVERCYGGLCEERSAHL